MDEKYIEEYKEQIFKKTYDVVKRNLTFLPIIEEYEWCEGQINTDYLGNKNLLFYVTLRNFQIRDRNHGHLLKIDSPEIIDIGNTEIYKTDIDVEIKTDCLKKPLIQKQRVGIIFH